MPVVFDQEAPVAPKPRGRIVFDEQAEPRMEDTVPGPGGKLTNPDGTEFQQSATPAAPERSWMDDVGDFRITPDFDLGDLWKTIKGAPETALSMANNAAAAGIAGVTAPFVATDDNDSADYIKDFMAENSYTPQGDSARELSGAIGDAAAPIEGGKRGLGDAIMESTGSPLAATAGYMAPDLATIIMGPKPQGPKPGVAPPLRKTPVMEDPVGMARAAGVKVLPSDVHRLTGKKPGLGDRIAEALAPEDVRRDMTLENQQPINQLAREKVKAPAGTRLNDRGIEKLKAPHFQTYEKVQDAINVVPPSEDYLFALDDATQRAGFPPGANPKVTEVISALRTKARRKINNPAADDKLEAEGRLAGQAADKLEEAMGTELTNTGQGELLAEYQNARQSLAELNDVKKTQRGGNVDPQAMRKLDKKNPDRLTGQTKLIADLAEDFPDLRSSMTGAGKKTANAGFGESKEGIIKKAAKKTGRFVAKASGLGDRLLVESEGFQNRMGKPASPAERSYFADYGKKKTELASSPGAVDPERGLEFGTSPGVVPSKSLQPNSRLELADHPLANPEVLPPKPDMLTADVVPRTRGDINPKFDARLEVDKLAGEMGLDVRSGTKGAIGERELSDLIAAQRSDGLEVAPPREMEQLDFPASAEQPRRLQLDRPPGTTSGKGTRQRKDLDPRDSTDELGDMLANNASGESSASAEAISRSRSEKAAGQDRFLIGEDDTVTPLVGVDAVDARAKPGQVIVQKGVGKDEYTILDRGGMKGGLARGRVQAAGARLREYAKEKAKEQAATANRRGSVTPPAAVKTSEPLGDALAEQGKPASMSRADAGEALFDRGPSAANSSEPVLVGYRAGADGPKTKTGDSARAALQAIVEGKDASKHLRDLTLQGSELPTPVRQSLSEYRELQADASATKSELQSAAEALVSDLRQYLGE